MGIGYVDRPIAVLTIRNAGRETSWDRNDNTDLQVRGIPLLVYIKSASSDILGFRVFGVPAKAKEPSRAF